MTPVSNSLPGLPEQQWSTMAWDAYVVAPTLLRPGRPCSAAISAKVTKAQSKIYNCRGKNLYKRILFKASTITFKPAIEVRPRKPVVSKVKLNVYNIHEVYAK